MHSFRANENHTVEVSPFILEYHDGSVAKSFNLGFGFFIYSENR